MQELKKKICIVDYSTGNIFSIQNALNFLGFDSYVSDDKRKILNADGIILPGVGNFHYAMQHILKKNLEDTLYTFSISKKPFLGTCLGMQLLFETSDELRKSNGLGILKGNVKKLPPQKNGLSLNIGWSKIKLNTNNENSYQKNSVNLYKNEYFYFIHSYHVTCSNNLLHTTSMFGNYEFCSSVCYKNILATQFHLEKSGPAGLNVLKNFFTLYA